MVATQDGTEFVMQAAMSTEKPQPHGNARNSQAFGHFLSGVLQDIAQETSLPEIGRELRDSTREKGAHLAARVVLLWSLPMGSKMLGKVFARFGITGLKGDVFGVAPLAKQVDGSVSGDAREGLHERFLLCVFGVSGIPRQPQGATIKTWRVGEDQSSECLAITKTRLS